MSKENEDWKSKTKNKLKRWKTADKVLNDLSKKAEQIGHPWLKEWIDRRFTEYLEASQ